MWLGLFQPLLHDRALAARWQLLGIVLWTTTTPSQRLHGAGDGLVFCQNAAHSYARHTSPLASPRKAVHTRSRGLHNRKESSFDQKPRVTGS